MNKNSVKIILLGILLIAIGVINNSLFSYLYSIDIGYVIGIVGLIVIIAGFSVEGKESRDI